MVARDGPERPLQPPLERARQLAAAFPFPLASALVFDTPRAAGGISHGTTGARCASPDNGPAASVSGRDAMWWIMRSTWPYVACTNNRRLSGAWQGAACGALLSRLAGALENRMKKPETELRLCARRYMSHCPEG